jgi:phage repressor protein C with HTH and peptisase S24 domain
LAAIVVGDSMLPAYRPGDVIIYRRDDGEWQRYVGQEVVVQLHDGRCLVKMLKRATKTTANLGSHNAPDIEAVRVDWAAPVLWVKRGR